MSKDKSRNRKQRYEDHDIPNDETMGAFAETDRKIKSGNIERFSGSTEDFLKKIMNSKA